MSAAETQQIAAMAVERAVAESLWAVAIMAPMAEARLTSRKAARRGCWSRHAPLSDLQALVRQDGSCKYENILLIGSN